MGLSSLLLNFDHGALPAASVEIAIERKYKKDIMGSLGSYVYLGFVIGSISYATVIHNNISDKITLCLAFALNGFGALVFCLELPYYLLAFARFMSGFGQILQVIYYPIYIKQFYNDK